MRSAVILVPREQHSRKYNVGRIHFGAEHFWVGESSCHQTRHSTFWLQNRCFLSPGSRLCVITSSRGNAAEFLQILKEGSSPEIEEYCGDVKCDPLAILNVLGAYYTNLGGVESKRGSCNWQNSYDSSLIIISHGLVTIRTIMRWLLGITGFQLQN